MDFSPLFYRWKNQPEKFHSTVDGYLAGSQLTVKESPSLANPLGEILRIAETNSAGLHTIKLFHSEENALNDLQNSGGIFGSVDSVGGNRFEYQFLILGQITRCIT